MPWRLCFPSEQPQLDGAPVLANAPENQNAPENHNASENHNIAENHNASDDYSQAPQKKNRFTFVPAQLGLSRSTLILSVLLLLSLAAIAVTSGLLTTKFMKARATLTEQLQDCKSRLPSPNFDKAEATCPPQFEYFTMTVPGSGVFRFQLLCNTAFGTQWDLFPGGYELHKNLNSCVAACGLWNARQGANICKGVTFDYQSEGKCVFKGAKGMNVTVDAIKEDRRESAWLLSFKPEA